jgi:hypothetical protein
MGSKQTRNSLTEIIVAALLIVPFAAGLGAHFHSYAVGGGYLLTNAYLWEIWCALRDLNNRGDSRTESR